MSFRRSLVSTVAAALVLSTASMAPVTAAPSAEVLGVSADGAIILTTEYDNGLGREVYKYTSTATGTSVILQAPLNTTNLRARSLSADGKTVIGSYMSNGKYEGFVWMEASGFAPISSLGGDYGSTYGVAVSADGAAATGYIAKFSYKSEPLYWSRATGTVSLGSLGGLYGQGVAISGDGSTVVGQAQDATAYRAFVWSQALGALTNIDTLYLSSSATQVSYDGRVVAGHGQTNDGNARTFRWTSADQMMDIGTLGGDTTQLSAMSDSGNFLVGYSDIGGNTYHAYRYDAAATSMVDLGTLGGTYSRAADITADGSVVVGSSDNADNQRRGFRWSQASGMVSIEDWMRSVGVTPGNYVIKDVVRVSDNGKIVAGLTEDYQIFFAREGQDPTGGNSGVITLDTFLPTVVSAGSTVASRQLHSADTVMFGAQGQPMRNLLSAEQKAVWGTVDIGHDEADLANGNLAVGEFGFGYGFSDTVTGRLGLGFVYSGFNLAEGGTVKNSGLYIAPEASIELIEDIYLTLGGFWSSASVKSNRGYLNGGVLDYSVGDTNAQTWGGKLRLDWVDALVVNDTRFTPYIGLSYASTSVDGYSETAGSFPVSYDGLNDHSTIARFGVDIVHTVSDDLRFLAKAEAAYQFEAGSSALSGAIIGVDSFTLPGQSHQRAWLRGGIGAEYDVAGGTASVMLNVTSKGQDPDVWIRSNFTLKF